MFNKDGINESLMLDNLHADTFNTTHGKQEQWHTRDYVQKAVWGQMINDLISNLAKEPVFFQALARYIDPAYMPIFEGVASIKADVDSQVTPVDTLLRDEIAQALAVQNAGAETRLIALRAITTQNKDMVDLLRKIVENTSAKETVARSSHPGLTGLGSLR